MNNPLRILQTLDRHLSVPAELTIFGRAALALGFDRALPQFGGTHDVDGILPLNWLEAGDANLDFWLAVQATNRELEPDDLYITHLFQEREIILRPDWASHRVTLPLQMHRLRVLRPAGLDLILTKMARGDAEDLADIRFLLEVEPQTEETLARAFRSARVPPVIEIEELFRLAQPKVIALARELTQPSSS